MVSRGRFGAVMVVCCVATAAWLACVDHGLVPCGELLCARGMVCTPGGCATADEVAVCSPDMEGMRCTAIDDAPRVCRGGACRLVVCGDNLTELEERCDDGDTEGSDGCSADCSSTEQCGNGFVDVALGEQCDSGARGLSGDGCSSRCFVEFELWRSLSFPTPSTRVNTGAVRDGKRRILRIGGSLGSADDGVVVNEVYAWDGATWRLLVGATPFPKLANMAAAYDPDRDMVVVFGGRDENDNPTGATLEWDGVDWTVRSTANSPSPRWGARMAYDEVRKRMVLFGGGNAPDTWEYDGVSWTQVANSGPSARIRHALAYDPIGQRVLLVGGFGSGNALTDTWSWDGMTWTQLPLAAPLSGRYSLSHEGSASLKLVTDAETLEMIGSGWQPIAPSVGVQVDQLINRPPLTAVGADGIHAWSGSAWQATSGLQQPGTSVDRAAYDTHRGRTVVTGGTGTFVATWEWDGDAWALVATSPNPASTSSAMTYDSVRRITVQFGGVRTGHHDETWTWNGSIWTKLEPATRPSPRHSSAFAFDEARGVGVLFGGATTGGYLSDTWEWDGTTWTRRMPTTSPAGRRGPAMAYDAARNRIVMFGGAINGTTVSAETWEWDGTTWTRAAPATSPTARMLGMMQFDWRRQRIVLVGGYIDAVGTYANDVWEWDGSTWTRRMPVVTLPGVGRYSFMDVRGDIHVFVSSTQHRLRSESLLADEDCRAVDRDADGDGLAGCSDPDCRGRCIGCGDGTCNAWLEDHRLCPADCAP